MIRRIEGPDGQVGHRSPLLERWQVPHLFTTRIGRTGTGVPLDLRHLSDAGWRQLGSFAGAPGRTLVRVHQVHGAGALEVTEDPLPDPATRADALITERSDVLLCVHVADCVPVLLAADGGRRVAVVHAGWRGIVAGVLPQAVATLRGSNVRAAIGPCISDAYFEVGPEVVSAFVEAGLESVVRQPVDQRARIDLRAAAEAQLRELGVAEIDGSDRCTYRHEQEYWSHRRDVTHGGREHTGRLGALIGVSG